MGDSNWNARASLRFLEYDFTRTSPWIKIQRERKPAFQILWWTLLTKLYIRIFGQRCGEPIQWTFICTNKRARRFRYAIPKCEKYEKRIAICLACHFRNGIRRREILVFQYRRILQVLLALE